MGTLSHACSTFDAVQATSPKSGLRADNTKFTTQHKELLSTHKIKRTLSFLIPDIPVGM
jgi:hypothetical protein